MAINEEVNKRPPMGTSNPITKKGDISDHDNGKSEDERRSSSESAMRV